MKSTRRRAHIAVFLNEIDKFLSVQRQTLIRSTDSAYRARTCVYAHTQCVSSPELLVVLMFLGSPSDDLGRRVTRTLAFLVRLPPSRWNSPSWGDRRRLAGAARLMSFTSSKKRMRREV